MLVVLLAWLDVNDEDWLNTLYVDNSNSADSMSWLDASYVDGLDSVDGIG